MMPSVVSMHLVNITFSIRPDEGMFFVMAKACLSLELILFFITFKELSLIYLKIFYINGIKLH